MAGARFAQQYHDVAEPPVARRSPQALALVPLHSLSLIAESIRRRLAEADLEAGPPPSPPQNCGSFGRIGDVNPQKFLDCVAGGSVLSPAPARRGDLVVEQTPPSAKAPKDQG